MNSQETSAKEQYSIAEEGQESAASNDTKERATEGASSTVNHVTGSNQTEAPKGTEQYPGYWSIHPAPFAPATLPPTWTVYTPERGQQERSNRTYPPPYPQYPRYSRYPRRNVVWPWVVLGTALLLILLVTGAFLLGAFGLYLGRESVTETRHFSIGAKPTLILNNDTGTIHVVSSNLNQEVTIEATKRVGGVGNINDISVSYAQDVASNSITVNVNRSGGASFFGSPSVDFTVTVPSVTLLQLKTNTGSIDVSGVSGQVVLTSNTGSLQVENGKLSGNSSLITNTGSVTFHGMIDTSGAYTFQTNTGSVNVTVPSESVFHVDASTDTGSINTNFPTVIVNTRIAGADAHSDVGNAPQATISLRTNTGSINLYQG